MYATWRGMCEKNEDVTRVCMQVKELVDMRDKYIHGVLNRGECSKMNSLLNKSSFIKVNMVSEMNTELNMLL